MNDLPSIEKVLEELHARNIRLPLGRVRVDGYGDSESLSDQLIALIRDGRKRAGTGLLWLYEYENDPLPVSGDIEIVVNHIGQPSVVTRVLSVVTQPFSEVSAEYAAIEGEGDGSLSYWREAHWSYFSRECHRIGREPSEIMPVVCSIFEVVLVVTPNDLDGK